MDAIIWQGTSLSLLDQTKLPLQEVWLDYTDYRLVTDAIRTMVVRGAPLIGITAGYAYCLAAMEFFGQKDFEENMRRAKGDLAASRPTAVNLFWALDRMEACRNKYAGSPDLQVALIAEAVTIHRQDVIMNRKIGRFGSEIVPEEGRILTHCNAGALASGGLGTALGVVRSAFKKGKVKMVYTDETRPLLQGARLTAWELMRDKIPVTLIADSMAASLMARGEVDLILVGCDRMAANGDFANKIGTYALAIAAYFHSIPVYTALPSSSIDLSLKNGSGIQIEERPAEEMTHVAGVQTAPDGAAVWNPAFDVTPHYLLTGIITEKGVVYPPFDENLRALFAE